jgi:hypothetical protein
MRIRSTLIITLCVSASTLSIKAQQEATLMPESSAYPSVVLTQPRWLDYWKNLNYTTPENLLTKEIAAEKRRRKPTAELEHALNLNRQYQQYLKSTDQVLIVDSIVVAKQSLLEAYPLSSESGEIRLENSGEHSTFTTERGNRIYSSVASADSLQTRQIAYADIEAGERSVWNVIRGLNIDGDCNYPFLKQDGITLYFAARSEKGLGNYDLYVSRWDETNGAFFPAENLGFPFNSYANDYLLVIDEEHDLGWFASDRYQSPDSVCVYTFVPNKSRKTVDFENTPIEKVRQLATLRGFQTLWDNSNLQQREKAHAAVKSIMNEAAGAATADFVFVVDDRTVYHNISDFKSEQAKSHYLILKKKMADFDRLDAEIDAQRKSYASAKPADRQAMRQRLLQAEEQRPRLKREIQELGKLICSLEIAAKK